MNMTSLFHSLSISDEHCIILLVKVIITRSETESQDFKSLLDEKGISSFIFPCIEYIEPGDNYHDLDNAIRHNHEFDWIIFLSKKAADAFFTRLLELGGHFFHINPRLKIACIGQKTADFIREQVGFPVDFVPSEYNSITFIQEFTRRFCDESLMPSINRQKILIPRQEGITDSLKDELEASGQIEVIYANAYKVTDPDLRESFYEELKNILIQENQVYITFASSKTVKNFKNKLDKHNIDTTSTCKIISIGNKTSETIKEIFPVNKLIEAKQSTLESMFNAILEDQQSHARI